MYTILKNQLVCFNSYHKLSSSFVNLQWRNTEKKYVLFNTITCQSCSSLQSTIINPNVTSKKQKKTHRKHDLIIVSNESAKQKKLSAQKLTSNDLKMLATTNINLSELYKLKNLSNNNEYSEEHTYNNLTVIPYEKFELFNEVDNSKINDINYDKTEKNFNSLSNFVIDPLDVIPIQNAFQPETEQDEWDEYEFVESSKKEKNVKLEQKTCSEIAGQTLAAYLEVCSVLKNPQKGLNALLFHNIMVSHSQDKSFTPLKNIRIYNALLKGFAARGDLIKLEEVINLIRKEKVKMNIQSFIAIFECLGRSNQENPEKIRQYCQEALDNDFNFDYIMNKGIFLNDEREIVLKILKSYDGNYTPQYWIPNLLYNNNLTNHLNNDQQLREPDFEFSPNNGLFTPNSLNEFIDKQLQLEKSISTPIKSIECNGIVTDDTRKYRETLTKHFKNWEETALKAFNRDLMALSAKRSPLNHEPYMRCIPVKDFIQIIIDEARKISEGSETYSPTVNQLYTELGNKVYARYKVLRKQKCGILDKILKVHQSYCQIYANSHKKLDDLPNENEQYIYNSRHIWQWCDHKLKADGATLSMDHCEWNISILQTIGKFLYHIIMHDLKVDVNSMRKNSKHKNLLPAFYTIFRSQDRKVKEEVKPHPILSKLFRASKPETLHFPTYELPMMCPPIPWTSIHNGGYLISPCNVVRLPSYATIQKAHLLNTEPSLLYPSLDSLNQLASIPWIINKRILDIILTVFNNGGSAKLDVPEPPSSLQPPPNITPDMDKITKYKHVRQKLQYKRKKSEMYSLWCDCLYRLSLANHFRNDVFWLPHNMDFRGRVYPVPPHLNHLGSDLARSMLLFAENRPLGPKGLDWLKIHLINLTGLKKRDPINKRLLYANSIMNEILDSADNPLNGDQWWMNSDEPWQTLACCMEIANVIRSNDPENYRTHFPIHQDGSCNGLQHYAALGRDQAGAYSVNLCASDNPQDVYSSVVTLVEKLRKIDAANNIEIAKVLKGFVTRKVIKQTVMTTVYGVTRFGARLQIARQLKDIDNFPKHAVWSASSYLTYKTFESLRTMFTSTKEIQDWFTECARVISGLGGHPIEWITPMGLPIVQPYIRFKNLSNTSVYKIYHMDKNERPNVMKQKNAFPPNFIHSLDSSHMMLTALNCERAGITFVSVHDCYWTHPSTIDIMNKICREQFVALHSEPILKNLSLFFHQKYNNNINEELIGDTRMSGKYKEKLHTMLRQLPSTGDFDIKEVLNSVYFFS